MTAIVQFVFAAVILACGAYSWLVVLSGTEMRGTVALALLAAESLALTGLWLTHGSVLDLLIS